MKIDNIKFKKIARCENVFMTDGNIIFCELCEVKINSSENNIHNGTALNINLAQYL